MGPRKAGQSAAKVVSGKMAQEKTHQVAGIRSRESITIILLWSITIGFVANSISHPFVTSNSWLFCSRRFHPSLQKGNCKALLSPISIRQTRCHDFATWYQNTGIVQRTKMTVLSQEALEWGKSMRGML
jgi:hypothetical protein